MSQGFLHTYDTGKVAFEYGTNHHYNVCIVIAGLTEGLGEPLYFSKLPEVFGPLKFSVVQIQLSSSNSGWGTGSLDRDVAEIAQLVRFCRQTHWKAGKIVLLGHSTGAQDVMHYLLSEHRDTVDGAILQGCVSDRQAVPLEERELMQKLTTEALKCDPDDILSRDHAIFMYETPITAYRWCSLMIRNGDDDYFSDDLDDTRLQDSFGSIMKPFLIAYSDCDEYVPKSVDKIRLLALWRQHTNLKFWSQNSRLVTGNANHALDNEDSQKDFHSMIRSFIYEFGLV